MAKASRRQSRKQSRKMKKRASRRSRMYGGGVLAPAGVNDASMMGPSNLSAAQGLDYARIHQGQHGGAYVSLNAAAPVGYTGVLDDSLRATARIGPIDSSIAAIQGMSDQAGGARRGRKGFFSAFRKSAHNTYRKAKRMGSKMMRSLKMRGGAKKRRNYFSAFLPKALRKGLRNTRRKFSKMMRGGGGYQYTNQADYASPGMLLPSSMEAKALMGMNPEWKLAADPASFAPNM